MPRFIKMLAACFLILNFMCVGFCFADDVSDYTNRLTTFLKDLNNQTTSVSDDMNRDFQKLLEFTKEFPNSEYVDDVEFIYLFGLAAGHKYPLDQWEALVQKNPNGGVSDLTKNIYKKYAIVLPSMNIPFSKILLSIKGDEAFWNEKNYKDAAKYYADYLKSLDYSNDLQKEAAFGAYGFLLVSYIKLKQKNNFERAKAEVLSLFPNKSSKINQMLYRE